MIRSLPRGLYVLTDAACPDPDSTVHAVRAALEGGARTVQYRDKGTDAERRLRVAVALRELCGSHGAAFIVNDDPELAATCGADGVHLGRDDAGVVTARSVIGRGLIGVSCYDSMTRARAAVAAGADYVAFGSVFPSPTKPRAVRASLDLLREACAALPVPVVAIGGITSRSAGALVEAGCHAVAVVTDVMGADDVAAAASRYVPLFRDPSLG